MLNSIIDEMLKDKEKTKVYTREEEQGAFLELKKGNAAKREEIIEHNLRIVLKVANKHRISSIPFDDLFQMGCIGLTKAVDKFDINKNIRFSTYAYKEVEETMKTEIAKNSRFHVNYYWKIAAIKSAINTFFIQNGYEPSISDLSFLLNLSERDIKLALKFIRENDIISLDVAVDDESKQLFMDKSVEELVIDPIYMQHLHDIMENVLSEKEMYIVSTMLSLFGKEKLTEEKIAEIYGVTGKDISHIYRNALKKIRKAIELDNLKTQKILCHNK